MAVVVKKAIPFENEDYVLNSLTIIGVMIRISPKPTFLLYFH